MTIIHTTTEKLAQKWRMRLLADRIAVMISHRAFGPYAGIDLGLRDIRGQWL